MACNTPVIATNHGAVPEVIEDGRSGIIVEHQPRDGRRPERADAPIRGNAGATEERFSPSRMVDDYVRAYRDALVAAETPVLSQ